MLVLGRQADETITIVTRSGEVITVMNCGKERIQLGFDADTSIAILRTELLKKEK